MGHAAIPLVVGATMSGRVPAPLGTKLPADDLVSAIAALGATVIIADARSEPRANETAELVGATVAVLGDLPRCAVPNVDVGLDDAAFIVHTSGTTGLPKPIEKWQEAGRLGATVALLVPTMIDILLSTGGSTTGSLAAAKTSIRSKSRSP